MIALLLKYWDERKGHNVQAREIQVSPPDAMHTSMRIVGVCVCVVRSAQLTWASVGLAVFITQEVKIKQLKEKQQKAANKSSAAAGPNFLKLTREASDKLDAMPRVRCSPPAPPPTHTISFVS
jgi:hypothetical protein